MFPYRRHPLPLVYNPATEGDYIMLLEKSQMTPAPSPGISFRQMGAPRPQPLMMMAAPVRPGPAFGR